MFTYKKELVLGKRENVLKDGAFGLTVGPGIHLGDTVGLRNIEM